MADTSHAGGDELRILHSMIGQAKEFLAAEPDSDDRAVMEKVLSGLINLAGAEASGDDTISVTAVDAGTGKAVARRLLVVPKSPTRWAEAARRLMQREAEAEQALESQHPEDDFFTTPEQRRNALRSELKAIQAELAESRGVDPDGIDRQARAILVEYGMLDGQNAGDES